MDSDLDVLRSATAYSSSGEKLGPVGDVYLDDASGRPAWATIHAGMFGGRTRVVPLEGARLDRDMLVLPFTKQAVVDAPDVAVDEQITELDESTLRGYYYHEGRDPQVPLAQDSRTGDHAQQVGDALRTDRPAGDFVDETDLDTLYDENGHIAPAAATASDVGAERVVGTPRTLHHDAVGHGERVMPGEPLGHDAGRTEVDRLGPDNGRLDGGPRSEGGSARD